jgi:hypothetical protein
MEYGFVLGDRYYGRLPARRTDAVSDKFALGHVGYVKMLEALVDEGVHMVEDGPGHYAHKLRYGGKEHLLRRQVITRPGLGPRFKTGTLLLWADIVHLLYYRVWFQKLSSLLRLPARPLRQFWIRSRV